MKTIEMIMLVGIVFGISLMALGVGLILGEQAPAQAAPDTPLVQVAPIDTSNLPRETQVPPTNRVVTTQGYVVNTPEKTIELKFHSISPYYEDNQFMQPRSGYKFMVVDFSVENVGAPNGYRFSPYDVRLVDPNNYQYEYASNSYGLPEVFDGAEIGYGQTRRGKLIFEVPTSLSAGTTYKLVIR